MVKTPITLSGSNQTLALKPPIIPLVRIRFVPGKVNNPINKLSQVYRKVCVMFWVFFRSWHRIYGYNVTVYTRDSDSGRI
jgi:hypothetical protein